MKTKTEHEKKINIETKVTPHQEICKIRDGRFRFHFEENCNGDMLNICSGINLIAQLKTETIHKLSETLKRHGKE